jgi:hypothetical protein
MLDNTMRVRCGDAISNVNINSVSGTIAKSTPDSIITRFHTRSKFAERLFDDETPHVLLNRRGLHTAVNVIVLQVMLCGEGELLAEYIREEKED